MTSMEQYAAHFADQTAALREKARRMRNAIEDIELALNGADELLDWAEKWKGSTNLAHITARIGIQGDAVLRIAAAYSELNNIVNDDAFGHHAFACQ